MPPTLLPGTAPALFRVARAEGAQLELRACGNAAAELLELLDESVVVEVRVTPIVDTRAERPITEAGRLAGWVAAAGLTTDEALHRAQQALDAGAALDAAYGGVKR
jgi:hypothetical protein